MRILIVTNADDLHALSVQDALRRRNVDCHILESDRLAGAECVDYSITGSHAPKARVLTSERVFLDISSIDTVWWRRSKGPQELESSKLSEGQIVFVNRECTTALFGLFESSFHGKWISSPRATEFASNKLNQLATAQSCGFRIPETLVSQIPSEIAAFYAAQQGRIIVKPVTGSTMEPILFTQMVTSHHLESSDAMRTCPAIYQEFIPGTKHIRLNCFGSEFYGFSIISADIDWRADLRVPISAWTIPNWLRTKVRRVLDQLGLEMGITDLKEMPNGEIVWLEVNPQGQFLFLEGLTGVPLTEHFADFLEHVSSRLDPEQGEAQAVHAQ